jgi:hypothetical protein
VRLWRVVASQASFDLQLFDARHYAEAVEAKVRGENIT